ncbi:MAG TPA: sigma-70 family RNA polymerase sigma factor [Thermoleophilaceae bacterium]|nr:sigma-70 family RNA polymerase sigma factor [Thermoleophilaceae bacterium]
MAEGELANFTRRAEARRPPEDERALIAAAEGGDAAASRELVNSFLPMIGGIARRFSVGDDVQRAELMQEGVAGLLFAAKRYDPRTKTPFWAYASFWVRKAMQEMVAEVTRPAALSDHAVRGLARIKAARRDLLQATGAEPTLADLAAATGLGREQLDSLLAVDRTPRSLDEPLGSDEGVAATVGEFVPDPHAESEYEQVLDQMEIQAVRHLADQLDERERAILSGHYGLGRSPRTLKQLGSDLGLTAERIRQIENGALEKLRAAAAEPPTTDAI